MNACSKLPDTSFTFPAKTKVATFEAPNVEFDGEYMLVIFLEDARPRFHGGYPGLGRLQP